MGAQPKIRWRDRVRARLGELRLGALWILRAIARATGLRAPYQSLIIHLIRRTELFDRSYYLQTNVDVAQENAFPLRHYVMHGDKEGRWPIAFFDPVYYRAHARGRTKHVNALLHYAYVGRFRRLSPSPWFNVDYYLRNNKDVARANHEPLRHFIKWGGREGRAPSPDFDTAFYLRSNPEVLESGLNPLVHYLMYGRLEGRRPSADAHGLGLHPDGSVSASEYSSLPVPGSWNTLEPRANVKDAVVDVIIPVYKGYGETLRCIHSVLKAASQTRFELNVIDDKSPEPELSRELETLAAQGLFTLLSNHANLGFVATVNRGMMLHVERDVVLLNSDTEVFDGWLDRLQSAAQRNTDVGTVTPLSNNATICSYPQFLHDNPYPLELSYAELDRLTANVNAGVAVEAPTGVGFCLYIKRACLEAVGLFDAEAFGKGYGEENDFCQRAIARGWKNQIAADVFVLHLGATSFQGTKAKRVQHAMKLMESRHPNYHQDVQAFIHRDPLVHSRRRLDWARLERMSRSRNVLIISHNRGGGTERHVWEDVGRLSKDGYGVFFLRPVRGKPSHVAVSHPTIASLPNAQQLAIAAVGELQTVLERLAITEVHTHSLVDLVPDAPKYLSSLVKSLGARWEVNIHDYKIICPRINLVDEHGHYCGEPAAAACNTCLQVRGSDFQAPDIDSWRAMHASALAIADSIWVPDEDVAQRLSRYFPEVRFGVSPHESIDTAKTTAMPHSLKQRPRIKVVVIGAIGKLKGYDVLLGCARDARKRRLPIDFALLGFSMNDRRLLEAGVHVTGKYQEHEALNRLAALEPDIVWLPSLWPETYSYTLSIALQMNCPVAAFDIGAIGARLRRLERAENLVPLALATKYDQLNAHFLKTQGGNDVCRQRAAS